MVPTVPRVLVTGSTAGIGRATAEAFARDGAHVVVNGRDPDRTAAVAAEISAACGNAQVRGVAADVATADGARHLAEQVAEVDVLVNNAGVFAAVPFFDIDDDAWRAMFETNVLSGIRLARIYTPGMVARGWGRVIFVSSESSVFIPTEMIHYGVSKTAQLSVARGLAQEVAGTGVTVNSVLPGPTLTEGVRTFVASRVGEDVPFEEAEHRFMAEERPTSLLGRLIRPEEVAAMIRHVGSEAASATTGAAVRVDGGTAPTIVP